jgi:hypothetical protein
MPCRQNSDLGYESHNARWRNEWVKSNSDLGYESHNARWRNEWVKSIRPLAGKPTVSSGPDYRGNVGVPSASHGKSIVDFQGRFRIALCVRDFVLEACQQRALLVAG